MDYNVWHLFQSGDQPWAEEQRKAFEDILYQAKVRLAERRARRGGGLWGCRQQPGCAPALTPFAGGPDLGCTPSLIPTQLPR
jgi:hypothetical protein